jgi:peptide/nickel transport system permease protein
MADQADAPVTRDARGQVRRRAGLRLWLSGGWLLLLAASALLAPWIAPKDPLYQDMFLNRLPPAWVQGSRARLLASAPTRSGGTSCRASSHAGQVALVVALAAGILTTLPG